MPVSYLLLGELPSLLGGIGILFVIAGTLFLSWDFEDPGFCSSLRTLFKQKGTLYMITAAFFSSLAVSFSKFAYRYVPPLEFAFYISLGLVIVFGPLAWRKSFVSVKGQPFQLIAANIAYGIGQALHYIGLSLLPAAYYISVKRSSILFDVFIGKFRFGESHFKTRLIGSIIMMAGLVCIALASVYK